MKGQHLLATDIRPPVIYLLARTDIPVYKSSINGLNPCGVPSLSSNQNLILSTSARSAIHSANAVTLVPSCSQILLYPAGAGISSLTLQPLLIWNSSLRM